ncbi:MAG TPA: glycosyl hydrolase [Burkholderiaceae bacterium]|nr:glycosyl hydrolase [Burkholderiaceae bacterium]
MPVAAALVALLASCAAGPRPPAFVHGPYKDVTIAFDPQTSLLATEVAGRRQPVTEVLRPGATLTWGFANGECGAEALSGLDAAAVAAANVAAFNRAGIGYIVSTGGEAGVFTCGSDDGMEAFIARYASPRLVGFDFDIEGKQTPEMVEALVRRIAVAQRRHPQLRFSFTLATQAASDGSRAGLNALGQRVLAAIRAQGLAAYTINLMVMDYGPPAAANCVVGRGVCDMGRSAIQAVDSLHTLHGVPYAQIELTAMLGGNDVADNDTLPEDAKVIARYAKEKGLAGIHFWSLDRDRPCPRPASGASPLCSGLERVPALAYSAAFDPAQR